YWQQVRTARQAMSDRDAAITQAAERTATQTTNNVTAAMGAQYKTLIDSLTAQNVDLKAQLAAQGKKVDAIGNSPFVRGSKPVEVEVTNNPPSQGDSNPPPVRQGHLTITQRLDVSSRDDAPVLTVVTVQSDIEFPTLKLVVFCDKNLVAAEGMISAPASETMISGSGVLRDHLNAAGFNYERATPPFGPANPVVFRIWSKGPIACTQAQTF
ncbi:MAG: hypothetical protein WBD46_12970, partial [Acidobacteriaceae bacterium]